MMSQRTTMWIVAGCSAVLLLGVMPVMAGETAWTAPAAEKGKGNPVSREAGVQEGKKVFDLNCSMCHGPAGKGDGPAGAALSPKPKDLTAAAVQAQTDGELFWKISTGRGAMPPWQMLPEKDRWSVVRYIRTVGGQKK
jgi:mono/diheme cytochrome c family protein